MKANCVPQLKKHRQLVAECVAKAKNSDAAHEGKATQLLAAYDAEIARKQKLWEALQVYAKYVFPHQSSMNIHLIFNL
jgi:hypothetical protein